MTAIDFSNWGRTTFRAILNDSQSKPFLDPAEPPINTATLTVLHPAIKIIDHSRAVSVKWRVWSSMRRNSS